MKLIFSIIIPTYKRTDSLKRLLQLLQRQTLSNAIEVIVIDQNSFVECFTPWIRDERNNQDGLVNMKQRIISKVNNSLFEISENISAAVFFRKEAFLRSGGFDVLLFSFAKTAEDQEFFLRLK